MEIPKWIDDCCNSGIALPDCDVLVLLELSVSDEAAEVLTTWYKALDPDLSPYLVIAGSGHMEDEKGRLMNRSFVLYPGKGPTTPEIAHLKVVPFEYGKCSMEAIERRGGTEEDPLIVLESPWGRISVLICKDVIANSVRGNDLIRSLVTAQVEHLFIPSYDQKDYGDFQDVATDLVRNYPCAFYLVDGGEKEFLTEKQTDSSFSPPWIVTIPGFKGSLPTEDGRCNAIREWLKCERELQEEYGTLRIEMHRQQKK
uniref:Carbon-nitrogen hydrolase n=1 Tax=Candidatus Kentrum sp. SD TaxID=2126332 RepID=A0A451BMN0_9GAMM|nr:MAG: hypothetical protein BECKSD772F_GA0070984_10509 [Candidatus Kentron sp. SD]VFK45366.1 MAG: hypothetical protein BECKSD772E_GA0070983_10528 [Candidatus Kentron sp. SD]VFK79530.1 MAG: hypothetical protein BECKSD772D_GA0070982_105310 [Candidatus Kentron sp. SD]